MGGSELRAATEKSNPRAKNLTDNALTLLTEGRCHEAS
jgi:hypothetical protein